MANESSSAAAQRRRVTKPLMERRRRARINRCLAELQVFLGSAIAQKSQRHQRGIQRQTRLEKADILEMTVSYIREAHYKQSQTSPLPTIIDDHSSGSDTLNDCVSAVNLSKRSTTDDDHCENSRFQEGYKLCMLEVAKFIRTTGTIRGNTHQAASMMSMMKEREYPNTERQELIGTDRNAEENVPVQIRRDKNNNDHLSASSGDERVTGLIKHLRNQYQSIEASKATAKESLTEEDHAVGYESPSRHYITSGGVKGRESQFNESVSSVETSRLSPHPHPVDFKTEKSPTEVKKRSGSPDSPREFVKEIICQNNHFWWRPW